MFNQASLDLKSFIHLLLLQQVKQMLRLQLQIQLLGDGMELGPLSTQSKFLQQQKKITQLSVRNKKATTIVLEIKMCVKLWLH